MSNDNNHGKPPKNPGQGNPPENPGQGHGRPDQPPKPPKRPVG